MRGERPIEDSDGAGKPAVMFKGTGNSQLACSALQVIKVGVDGETGTLCDLLQNVFDDKPLENGREAIEENPEFRDRRRS